MGKRDGDYYKYRVSRRLLYGVAAIAHWSSRKSLASIFYADIF